MEPNLNELAARIDVPQFEKMIEEQGFARALGALADSLGVKPWLALDAFYLLKPPAPDAPKAGVIKTDGTPPASLDELRDLLLVTQMHQPGTLWQFAVDGCAFVAMAIPPQPGKECFVGASADLWAAVARAAAMTCRGQA